MKIIVAAFASISLILAACSSNTTTPTTVTVVQPKTGSTFTQEEFRTDTTTGAPIPSTRETFTYTLSRTGISFFGKSNVSELTNVEPTDTSTIYFNYESNGDVSMFVHTSETDGEWLLLPISSKTTSTVTVMDTTIDVFGLQMKMKSTMTTSYAGTENFTVKGQAVSTMKIKNVILSSVSFAGGNTESTSEASFYFAPSLGYFTKMETPVFIDPNTGEKAEGSVSILIDYNLKY